MPEPVPILFTIPNFITAGSGRALLNIVARLDRRHFAPSICVQRRGGSLETEIERLGIPLIEAPFTVPAQPYRSLLWRAWKASQPLRPYGFRLWHSFHYLDDFSEPIIARMAGARAWIYTKKNMNWHRRTWYLRTLLATRVAAQNSDMLREMFATRWFRHKARPIYRGVDADRFRPDLPRQPQLRAQWGVSPSAVIIGCVAHLVPVKGHPTLIEALARVPGVYLVIAGNPLDEKYAASLMRRAGELQVQDRVRFLGDVKDVPGLLTEVDLFVLPTWRRWRMEGCPVSLLEAMACGKACVATDIPGSRDLVQHGRSGWVVPGEDIEALAAALSELSAAEALRRELGRAARERVLECFTIDREVAAHQALYHEVLRSN